MEGDLQREETQSILVNDASLRPKATSTRPQLSSIRHAPPSSRIKSKKTPRRFSRPSTAPSKETSIILPAVQMQPSTSSSQSRLRDFIPVDGIQEVLDPKSLDQRKSLPNSGQGSDSERLVSLPHDSSRKLEMPSACNVWDISKEVEHSDYDWATFIGAYASGKWDPRRSPKPPRSYLLSPEHLLYSISERPNSTSSRESHSFPSSPWPLIQEYDSEDSSSHGHGEGLTPRGLHSPTKLPPSGGSAFSESLVTSQHSLSTAGLEKTRKYGPSSTRVRNSVVDIRPSDNTFPVDSEHVAVSSPEAAAAAATMRWAAARVNLAPLALPSPERELTDPMHGVTAVIPGSHSNTVTGTALSGMASVRKRLGSFWQGTQDVEKVTAVINAADANKSPFIPSSELPIFVGESLSNRAGDHDHRSRSPLPAASAPILRECDPSSGDYFADVEEAQNHVLKESQSIVRRRISGPMQNLAPASVPALPRRVCLTRQTSSPLPEKQEFGMSSGKHAREGADTGRAAKEEQMFAELGYLAPPNPPDELERRRALYKFNLINTGPDLNFDRIAHLAKLVFNTKIVFISLIDGNEQWFKTEWGLQMSSCPRTQSICAHSILQQGDEPMVVLDTHVDWRFAKNPLVTGHPNIRFYAGAPLRTQDGFNIGSLSVVDDVPREEFSPRHRHALKEFAAIVLREMELWRDKIQLRIRDRIQSSMEQFSRECLEIDTEAEATDEGRNIFASAPMEKVYERAAKLVKRTLDVEGVVVLDVSNCEVSDAMNTEGTVPVVVYNGDLQAGIATRPLSSQEYLTLSAFFAKYPDGKISEGIVPASFRPFLPTRIRYALTVPIFNIDKRPFAVLCAYNASDQTKRFLEGHELSYLRAIGVIILSAVLKRRMLLADKAKSLFISNISHELRTPLHGILAAAELLDETPLDHNQVSFLQTVHACGTSLVETVNHVLDFTKLSGNAKAGGVENVIHPSMVDLIQLVEEAVDGCWIGHQARMAAANDFDIGSVYAPPKEDGLLKTTALPSNASHVEVVIDIGYREGGWVLKCEKGGIRRVLMNLFGNSLKFTSDGLVHVTLRQLPQTDDIPPGKIRVELSVIDTGKGISQHFLKNQLFHPFSQENPLQTGTGLGLAIVNSIIQSDSVGGKVDVWSEEGVGTEVKVNFLAEVVEDSNPGPERMLLNFEDPSSLPSVTLLGFDLEHRGSRLLSSVLTTWLSSWWGFKVQPNNQEPGDIILLNGDDLRVVEEATQRKDTSRPFVCLLTARGNVDTLRIMANYSTIGGFCRTVHKPGGPSRLLSVMKLCLHFVKFRHNYHQYSAEPQGDENPFLDSAKYVPKTGSSILPRRHSDERSRLLKFQSTRPTMPRSSTIHPLLPECKSLSLTAEREKSGVSSGDNTRDQVPISSLNTLHPTEPGPTITFGVNGTLLESSVGTIDKKRSFRVLVVEDNAILRNLLIKWLQTKSYEYRDAEDGRSGVAIFEKDGPFDIVLLDMSMPILDGIGASIEIRQIESTRASVSLTAKPTRILALTGMSSSEDKRKAFMAGVDGYLVKPVAFKVLDEMFHRLAA